MLWSQFSAIFDNFRRQIFSQIPMLWSKLSKFSFVLNHKRQFFSLNFWRKYLKIYNIGPGSINRTKKEPFIFSNWPFYQNFTKVSWAASNQSYKAVETYIATYIDRYFWLYSVCPNSFCPTSFCPTLFVRPYFDRLHFVRLHFVRLYFVRLHFVRLHFVRLSR
jgi:hypothetical protein